jgi:2-oxoglutarate ferredoxin oxidoreductase subunit gamma
VIAGSGGQGVLLSGILIAQTAMRSGLNTTWFPSYGPEMRGGMASSVTIISNDEIGSPLLFKPNVLVALNELSLNKFICKLSDEAIIVANSSIILHKKRYKIYPYFIPASYIADKKVGNLKTANMVILGALIGILEAKDKKNSYKNSIEEKYITLYDVLLACEEVFLSPKLIEVNKKALKIGYDFIACTYKKLKRTSG